MAAPEVPRETECNDLEVAAGRAVIVKVVRNPRFEPTMFEDVMSLLKDPRVGLAPEAPE